MATPPTTSRCVRFVIANIPSVALSEDVAVLMSLTHLSVEFTPHVKPPADAALTTTPHPANGSACTSQCERLEGDHGCERGSSRRPTTWVLSAVRPALPASGD